MMLYYSVAIFPPIFDPVVVVAACITPDGMLFIPVVFVLARFYFLGEFLEPSGMPMAHGGNVLQSRAGFMMLKRADVSDDFHHGQRLAHKPHNGQPRNRTKNGVLDELEKSPMYLSPSRTAPGEV
jgi:hypothetical protein